MNGIKDWINLCLTSCEVIEKYCLKKLRQHNILSIHVFCTESPTESIRLLAISCFFSFDINWDWRVGKRRLVIGWFCDSAGFSVMLIGSEVFWIGILCSLGFETIRVDKVGFCGWSRLITWLLKSIKEYND